MNAPAWLLNGVDLNRPDEGIHLTAASSPHPEVSAREALLALKRRSGVRPIPRGPIFDAPVVGLEWLIEGDETQQWERRSFLAGLLTRPHLEYQRRAGSEIRQCRASLVAISEPSGYEPGEGVEFKARIRLDGVFMRSTAFTLGTAPVGTTTLDSWACSGPIDDATVRFGPGPATAPISITDTAWGEGVSYQGPELATDQYLYINVDHWRAWVTTSDSNWTALTSNRTQYIRRNPAGALQLRPSTQGREVTVTVVGAPAVIRARRSYL